MMRLQEQPILLFLFVLTASCIYVQESVAGNNSNPFYPSSLTSASWKGNNAPYSEARDAVEREIATGQVPGVLALKYKALYRLHPTNTVALFQWAYATRKAALAAKPFETGKVLEVLDVMNKDKTPHPYDFVRLQFLLASDVWPSANLKPLGQRLLDYKPNDDSVQYELVVDMKNSTSLDDKKQAISIAEEIARRKPNDPASHALLGTVYSSFWTRTKQRSAADKAISEYKIFLQTASADDSFRQGAEQMMQVLQRYR